MAENKEKKTKQKKASALDALVIAEAGQTKVSPSVPNRLKVMYDKEIAPALIKEFGFKSLSEAPKLEKIIINTCVKESVGNPKVLDNVVSDLTLISGQRAVVTRAKKSIATFKLREGMPIGARVTLRRARMYEFLDRLINIGLPRVRDFRGVSSKAFDGRGNYSLGIKEQIIFPEISFDKVDSVRGLTITIVTTAKKNEHARSLLTSLGMPFKK